MSCFFFFNDTATTEIYTLSLHDALPISHLLRLVARGAVGDGVSQDFPPESSRADATRVGGGTSLMSYPRLRDRKSTRLNSSHANISYAVFCLKKKKITSHN